MANNPFDPYYSRSEVSNSDLTSLKYKLYPQLNFLKEKDKLKAFHLGTLIDCLVTEPEKANHYRFTVDDEQYTEKDWKWGISMRNALIKASKKDKFLEYVLANSDSQKWFSNEDMVFEYECFTFSLPVRCKFDWWLGNFGGDLKTTAATTQAQFEAEIDFVDWDRSRAYYMDIVHSINPLWGNQDFIYAISKKNKKVFFKKILRGDETYLRGREKYMSLAFKYWFAV